MPIRALAKSTACSNNFACRTILGVHWFSPGNLVLLKSYISLRRVFSQASTAVFVKLIDSAGKMIGIEASKSKRLLVFAEKERLLV